jgi:RecB family exonuclease
MPRVKKTVDKVEKEDVKSVKMPSKPKAIENLRPATSFSPSMLETLNQCTLKYWYRYKAREKAIVDSVPLRFGSAVHKSLDELGKRLMTGEPLTAELCEEFAQDFVKKAATYRISDPTLIKEGQDFIRARLFKHNPNYRVVATEMNYRKKFTTQRGTPITGIIDLVLEAAPDTAIIVDYKTSRLAKTYAECKTDTQLSMYDLLTSKAYPQYQKIWLALDFVRSEIVITDRTLEERANFEMWLDSMWDALGDMTEKDVKPTINEYCGWCEYKHLCPGYKSALEAEIEIIPAASISEDTVFTKEWKNAKALEKIAKNRVAELKQWANARVNMEGMSKFDGDDATVSWSQSKRTFYDVASLVPHIPSEDLPRLVSISNGSIESYVHNERPDLKPILNQAARTTPASPRITMRKK